MKQIDCEQLVQDNRQICLRMERLANRFMEAEGLTAVQGHLLLYILLKGDSGTSLTAIHREFGYSKATLSNMLKRLREKGYVRVASCAGDDRFKLLFATEKGEQVRAFLETAIRDVQQQVYGCFSEQELSTLDRLQKKLLQNLCVSAEKNIRNQKEESDL